MSDWNPPTTPVPPGSPARPDPAAPAHPAHPAAPVHQATPSDPWARTTTAPTTPPTSPPTGPPSGPPSAPPGWSAAAPPPTGPAPTGPPPGSDGGRRGGGARPWLAALGVLVAVLLVAGGVGLGASLVGDDGDGSASGPAADSGTSVTVREPDDAPLEGTGDEPVADVAEAVSPAVVQLEVGQGLGSGVVYDAEGLILTAAHVVEGADTVAVRFSDGTSVDGEVVGTNAFSDVAVVRIEPFEDLPVAALGTSAELQPGQSVVALGSPFGLDQTVTSGIVSAVNRPAATTAGIINMIQTDTAINPGNSGGPLVDIQGRVIGLNDQIFTQSGGSDGIGLAIPIDLAVRVGDTLVAGDPVEFGFLGVGQAQEVGSAQPGDAGAVVANVESGSAAAEAGLQEGDRVLAIDGEPVGSFEELAGIVSAETPGSTVTLLVERGGDQQEVEVVLGAAQRD